MWLVEEVRVHVHVCVCVRRDVCWRGLRKVFYAEGMYVEEPTSSDSSDSSWQDTTGRGPVRWSLRPSAAWACRTRARWPGGDWLCKLRRSAPWGLSVAPAAAETMDLDDGVPATGATRRALGPGTRQIGKAILLPHLAINKGIQHKWIGQWPNGADSELCPTISGFPWFPHVEPEWPNWGVHQISVVPHEYHMSTTFFWGRNLIAVQFPAQGLGVLHAGEFPSSWGRPKGARWTWWTSCI